MNSETLIEDTLEAMRELLSADAEEVAKYVRELELVYEAQIAESKRLKEEAEKTLLRIETAISSVDEFMRHTGQSSIQAGAYKFSYQKGREVVEIDETQLPKKYWVKKVDEKPMDKMELRKLLAAGEKIKGVNIIRKPDTLKIK